MKKQIAIVLIALVFTSCSFLSPSRPSVDNDPYDPPTVDPNPMEPEPNPEPIEPVFTSFDIPDSLIGKWYTYSDPTLYYEFTENAFYEHSTDGTMCFNLCPGVKFNVQWDHEESSLVHVGWDYAGFHYTVSFWRDIRQYQTSFIEFRSDGELMFKYYLKDVVR